MIVIETTQPSQLNSTQRSLPEMDRGAFVPAGLPRLRLEEKGGHYLWTLSRAPAFSPHLGVGLGHTKHSS